MNSGSAADWPPWQRFVRWRHRHTPYRDAPPFSPYSRRLSRFVPELRAVAHFPVVRAQTGVADRLESSRWLWWRAALLLLGALVALALVLQSIWAATTWLILAAATIWVATAVRDVVYCVDCGAEGRRSRLRRRLVGPIAGHDCPGRADGSVPLSSGAASY